MIRENAFQPDSRILAAFTAMVLIGGTNFVAVRLSDRGLAPLYGAGLRFVGAAVLLCIFLVVRHGRSEVSALNASAAARIRAAFEIRSPLRPR